MVDAEYEYAGSVASLASSIFMSGGLGDLPTDDSTEVACGFSFPPELEHLLTFFNFDGHVDSTLVVFLAFLFSLSLSYELPTPLPPFRPPPP